MPWLFIKTGKPADVIAALSATVASAHPGQIDQFARAQLSIINEINAFNPNVVHVNAFGHRDLTVSEVHLLVYPSHLTARGDQVWVP